MLKSARFRSFLCSVVVLIGLVEFLHGRFHFLVYFGGAVALLTFLATLPFTAIYTRLIAFSLCFAGMAALITSWMLNPDVIIEGFKEMTPLIALIAAVSLLGIPLGLGEYAELFQGFYSRARHLYQTYIVSLIISYSLALLATLGSVTSSYYLVNENLNKIGLERNGRFDTTSVIRGFAMAMLVSPAASTVGIALQYSGLSWLDLAAPVFALSTAGLAAAFLFEPSWRSKASIRSFKLSEEIDVLNSQGSGQPLAGFSLERYAPFMIIFFVIISSIFFLGNVLHFPSMNSISIACLLAILAWGIYCRRLPEVLNRSANFFKQDILRISDQIILFLSAGFFTHSMESSGYLTLVGDFIAGISGKIGMAAILCLVPVVILALAFIGLHPLASSIIIGKTLFVSALNFNPLGLAAALLSGGVMSYMVSPFAATILLVSTISGNSPYRVGVRWNLGFVAIFWGIAAVFIRVVSY
ncbi:MAG: hypothetical protein GX263_08460 [Firmicutes bacterium]|nr:hypothetical protein [Bacillota bacterium]